ncbi:peroxisome assembly protein 12 [Agrilus planipennis]|uniref:Peroxisome assembly protein 12 n=1 Tax=Agrilus planipennis TaxID=224129 RepID=A0A1W4WG14_AGRPL|nr:peroxisome assembly protein 12 [Agrilus planipennis]
MAEIAAHLTATSEARPSLFEIIAQKSLDATLYPAFNKVAEFLAACFPNKCKDIPRYSDEIFLILKGLLEYNYLRKRDASFSEYFYGLKRVSVSDNNVHKLKTLQRCYSLIVLVGVPYLKRKLENKIEQYTLETLDGTCHSEFERKCKKSVIFLHSSGEMFWNLWTFVQYLKYIGNRTDVQLPELLLIKLKLVYAEETLDFIDFWSQLFKGELSASEIVSGILHNGLATALEISAFFLQFLKVWNDEKMNYNLTSLPKVAPPEYDQKSNTYKGICPICLQKQKIPTVLPVSGYVFCFPCILNHLKQSPKCPVTNLPANSTDLVRIYDSQ